MVGRSRAYIVLLLVALIHVAAASQYPVLSSPLRPLGSITVTDALNRTVAVPENPSRVVLLSPAITETVFALGRQDVVVGVDAQSYSTKYMGINEYCKSHGIEVVGGYWNVSVEKILGLDPDLVIADEGAHARMLETFTSYNLTVVYVKGGAARNISDVYWDIRLIGKVLGADEKTVDNVIKSIASDIVAARGMIAGKGLSGKRVVIVIDTSSGIWVAGRGTFIDSVLSEIGLANAVDEEGWVSLNPEKLAEIDPDIYVTMSPVTAESLTSAGAPVSGKTIVELNSTATDSLSRPGPRVGRGALMLAQAICSAVPSGEENEGGGGGANASTVYIYIGVAVLIAVAVSIALFVARRRS